MGIKENLELVYKDIKEYSKSDVKLLAVTKLHDVSEINEAISYGVTDIAENKVQEILNKYDRVSPVKWHLIGHLQTNKVKYIIDKVSMIHSVDSLKLASEIDKRASNINTTMDILLQVNIAREESKYGIYIEDLPNILKEVSKLKNVNLMGLMMIAPYSDNPEDVRKYFKGMKDLYDKYKEEFGFKYLSMGMSNDYKVALEEGSNVIRVGTKIFGNRDYSKKQGK